MNRLVQYLGTIPDIAPEAPPGSEGIITILNWTNWGVIILCLGVFLVSAGILVVGALTGTEVKGAKALVISVIGSIVIGGAAGIIRMFVN